MTNTELQAAASRLVEREVHLCLSSMVSTLASDAYNLPQGETEKLCSQAAELCAPVLDYEEAADQAKLTRCGDGTCLDLANDLFPNAQSACEANDIEPHAREVYEHWAVSQWLAEKLIDAGERVDTDFAGLNVWARTTTGQSISMDDVIERIARVLHV